MFGGGGSSKKQKPEDALRQELQTAQQQLKEAKKESNNLKDQLADATKKLETSSEDAKALEGELAESKSQLTEVTGVLEKFKSDLAGKESEVAKKAKELEDFKKHDEDLKKKVERMNSVLEEKANQLLLDVTVGECEFASPFPYSIVLQVRGRNENWSTDVSSPSERPIFNKASFLLPIEQPVSEDDVILVSAFVTVTDPVAVVATPITRLLGEASVRLAEVSLVDADSARSKRAVRNLNFIRASKATDAEGDDLLVGRVSLVMQMKSLTPSQLAQLKPAESAAMSSPLPSSFPSLDKSLWPARVFQHRLRAIVHRVDCAPAPPEGSRATMRFALRLTRPDGNVMHESTSIEVPVKLTGAGSCDVALNTEALLPLPSDDIGELSELRVRFSVEMVVSGDSTGVSSLLDLSWPALALALFVPVHVVARPSPSTAAVASFVRPKPVLLVTLVREPSHGALAQLEADGSLGTEIRIHGVPAARPLPDVVERAIVALCPEPMSVGTDVSSLRIPAVTYFYDQPLEFGSFLKTQCRVNGRGPRFFLTPVVEDERTPRWGQYVLRCNAAPGQLSNLSLLLFDFNMDYVRNPDAPFAAKLLGFATLDATALVALSARGGEPSSEPMQRSYCLDLRLLEAPGAAPSLEVEARIWPPGVSALMPSGPSAGLASGAVPGAKGAAEAGPKVDADDFRMSPEVSVHLAKEFNMRAAALKRAGEEIVTLRRQIQVLEGSNAQLKSQLDDEEKIAEEVLKRPPPEGLDKLSSVELASKLQRALERYREERAKGAVLSRRLEEVLKDAARGRGLEKSMAQLEEAHLEQNRELQRLQEDSRKMEAYRQTARAQEKVITKLEKILEGSLQEVQNAQRAQVDLERMKTENLRLKERQAQLVAARQSRPSSGAGNNTAELDMLRARLAEAELELSRLRSKPAVGSHAAGDREIEAQRSSLEWEQKCKAAEQRWRMLEQQLTECSRRYGAEISSLKVEIAKRDATIKEKEVLLKNAASGR